MCPPDVIRLVPRDDCGVLEVKSDNLVRKLPYSLVDKLVASEIENGVNDHPQTKNGQKIPRHLRLREDSLQNFTAVDMDGKEHVIEVDWF